jgi:cell pole-organizing protein PopZ
MSTSKQAQSQSADQDMDQILAQIRKIIADDPSAIAHARATSPVQLPPLPVAPRGTGPAIASPAAGGLSGLSPALAAVAAPIAAPFAAHATTTVADPSPPAAAKPSAALTAAFLNAPVDDDLSDLFEAPDTGGKAAPAVSLVAAPIALSLEVADPPALPPLAAVRHDTSAEPGPALVNQLVASASPIAPSMLPAIATQEAPKPVPIATAVMVSSVPPPTNPAPAPSPVVTSQTLSVTMPVSAQPSVPAPAMNFATLTANRVDQMSAVRAPSTIPLPSHIAGRTFETPTPAASSVAASPPLAASGVPTLSAPVLTAGSALGELAAGLAASGLVIATPPVEMQAKAPPPALVAEASAAVTLVTEALAVATPASGPAMTQPDLGPVLQQWLDANLPRIVETAIKDAMPDLLKSLKS